MADEWIDELMIKEGKVNCSRGLQKNLKVTTIQRSEPLDKSIVHSEYRLKLNNSVIEGLSESEQGSDIDDSHTETYSNYTEFANSQ